MPLDLMRFGDDYLYPEYVFGTCVDDRTAFVQSPFECGLERRRDSAVALENRDENGLWRWMDMR